MANRPILTLTEAIIVGGIAAIGFSFAKCARDIEVTQYDGWNHRCERAGGVPHDGKCFEPNALVEVPEGE